MIWFILFLISVMVSLSIGLYAAWSDYRGMVIPNWCSVLVIVMFCMGFGAAYFAGAGIFSPWWVHLLSMVVTFVVTFILFAANVFGGGDSKLITAFSLWVAGAAMAYFLFYMSIMGVVLGVVGIVLKKWAPVRDAGAGTWVARAQSGESVIPYGIAIAFGAVCAFWGAGYISLDTMKLFF